MLFQLAFGNKPLLFCLNLCKKLFRCAFFRTLLYKLAFNGILQQRFLHVGRKALVEFLQPAPGLFVTVDVGQKLFDFGDDALLFCERRERNGYAS